MTNSIENGSKQFKGLFKLGQLHFFLTPISFLVFVVIRMPNKTQYKSGNKTFFNISDIDECLSDPCEEGMVCVDKVNSYICRKDCDPGYTGKECETG